MRFEQPAPGIVGAEEIEELGCGALGRHRQLQGLLCTGPPAEPRGVPRHGSRWRGRRCRCSSDALGIVIAAVVCEAPGYREPNARTIAESRMPLCPRPEPCTGAASESEPAGGQCRIRRAVRW